MLDWIALATLALTSPKDATPEDAAKELSAALDSLGRIASYAFTSETHEEGGPMGRGGPGPAPGMRPPQPSAPIEGVFQRGLPLRLESGRLLAFKDGELVVYRQGEEAWRRILGGDVPASPGGRRGPGGEGDTGREGREGGRGDRSGGSEGSSPPRPAGRGGGDDLRMLPVFVHTPAPHEPLAVLAAHASGVERESLPADEGAPARTRFRGELTAAGAEALGAWISPRSARFARAGEGELQTTARFTLELEAGLPREVKLEVRRSGKIRETPFERTSHQLIRFERYGEAKVELPPEALAQFEV